MWPFTQLYRYLAVAIIMVAAYLVPSVAFAHAGHGNHDVPIAVSISSVTLDQDGVRKAAQEVSASAFFEVPQSDQRWQCDGKCCDPLGHGCCGSAVIAVNTAELTQSFYLEPLHIKEDLKRASLTAEALPKPPRSFV